MLATGQSDDVFTITNRNLEKFFEYEERLCLDAPQATNWVDLAQASGLLHHSQDIVTARSSYLSFRVMIFCLSWGLPMRWQLFIGHQPKKESYRIILDSFKNSPEWHIIIIDDAEKHLNSFKEAAEETNMAGGYSAILTPQIRHYTEDQLKLHYKKIMGAEGAPSEILDDSMRPGMAKGVYFVLPNGRKHLKKKLLRPTDINLHKEKVVNAIREPLEKFSDDVTPNEPKTTEHLFFLYTLLKEPR